jgi:hypothetical protein
MPLARLRWFLLGPWGQMRDALPALERAPGERDRAALRGHFLAAVAQGRQVLKVRFVVTVLLSLGAMASLATLAGQEVFDVTIEALPEVAETAEAAAPGAEQEEAPAEALLGAPVVTVALLLARFALDRLAALCAGRAASLAMQLGATPMR